MQELVLCLRVFVVQSTFSLDMSWNSCYQILVLVSFLYISRFRRHVAQGESATLTR